SLRTRFLCVRRNRLARSARSPPRTILRDISPARSRDPPEAQRRGTTVAFPPNRESYAFRDDRATYCAPWTALCAARLANGGRSLIVRDAIAVVRVDTRAI